LAPGITPVYTFSCPLTTQNAVRNKIKNERWMVAFLIRTRLAD
jgi:hypothetical protein